MRLAIAQIDAVVGDISGNLRRALEAVGRAEEAGAALTLLPELALTGYPPEDLLHKQHFVHDNLEALREMAAGSRQAVVVGFVDRGDGRLHNSAALCRGGEVVRVYHKRRLPNYGVFDERRYFEPGTDECIVGIEGEAAALTVCEDVWVPELVAEAVTGGSSVVVNISASPFHMGKGVRREEMLSRRARDNGVWLAYCNLVGGQDELVFDGRSAVFSPEGEVVARARSFEEDLLVVDLPPGARSAVGRIEPVPAGEEEVYAALRLGLGDYIRKNGFTDAVLGLSGGVDSSLTAVLAADTLGASHVHGVLMPSPFSSEGSLVDARALADNLGIDTFELPIGPAYEEALSTLRPVFQDRPFDVAEENLQARIRGLLLMGLSNKFGWIVLATGNKSELSVGYSTLYGDLVGGFAPIKDVLKTQVYDLSRWRNSLGAVIPEATLSKVPSAELRPGQTDRDTLPSYEVLDAILRGYVEEDHSPEEIVGHGNDEETVLRVTRMVDAAEYKRRQGPLGIKITPKAFGRDRRMPVTNRYGR